MISGRPKRNPLCRRETRHFSVTMSRSIRLRGSVPAHHLIHKVAEAVCKYFAYKIDRRGRPGTFPA